MRSSISRAASTLTGVLAGVVVLAGVAAAQFYHDTVYLYGGHGPSTNSSTGSGVWKVAFQGSTPQTTLLFVPGQCCLGGVRMDADNRCVVFGVGGTLPTSKVGPGPKSGLFRYDPATGLISTIWAGMHSTLGVDNVYKVHVDQNGDYLCGVHSYRSLPTEPGYRVLKITPGGKVTTFLSSLTISPPAPSLFLYQIDRDIDTGMILVNDGRRELSPTTVRQPIWEVDPLTGALGTWAPGVPWGWYGYFLMPQNHRTGAIEGPHMYNVFQVKRGRSSTTLATLWCSTGGITGAGAFDLQTAPALRQIAVSPGKDPYGTWLHVIDAAGWKAQSVNLDYRTNEFSFTFYRGRHLQTVSTGPHRWEIRVSCPGHAGKPYALAAGTSGVRPGLRLADGRNINLNYDPVVLLTLTNRLPGIWSPGPGVLDAHGEARGRLDLSGLNRPATGFGYPLWIVVMVLDPKVSGGIAYLPDTYVMRI